jgi:hypothetical protein
MKCAKDLLRRFYHERKPASDRGEIKLSRQH